MISSGNDDVALAIHFSLASSVTLKLHIIVTQQLVNQLPYSFVAITCTAL